MTNIGNWRNRWQNLHFLHVSLYIKICFSQISISYILHIPVPFEFCLEGDFSVSSRRIYYRSYHYRPQNVIHFYKILSDFPPPYRFCKVFISLSLAPSDHPLSAFNRTVRLHVTVSFDGARESNGLPPRSYSAETSLS